MTLLDHQELTQEFIISAEQDVLVPSRRALEEITALRQFEEALLLAQIRRTVLSN